MSSVKLIWATQDAEKLLGYIARVSNPANQQNESVAGLLKYMIRNKHWSPFEMVNVCFEINTTRDISRQILRHRSFSAQEFSQRYSSTDVLPEVSLRECRMQDATNRQSSLETTDVKLITKWAVAQESVNQQAQEAYKWALENGIAKEVARSLLPEGLTPTSLYLNGTLRSWLHYTELRCDKATQKEHRVIAELIRDELQKLFPSLFGESL
jgi:thymidylate synthase (FAD)